MLLAMALLLLALHLCFGLSLAKAKDATFALPVIGKRGNIEPFALAVKKARPWPVAIATTRKRRGKIENFALPVQLLL